MPAAPSACLPARHPVSRFPPFAPTITPCATVANPDTPVRPQHAIAPPEDVVRRALEILEEETRGWVEQRRLREAAIAEGSTQLPEGLS
jgi:hypothetical protein